MKQYWIAIVLALSAGGTGGAELDNAAAQALMKKHGCTACHEVDKKVIGPAFRDVAARHKDDKDAPTKLANKVKKGKLGLKTQGGLFEYTPEQIQALARKRSRLQMASKKALMS